MLDSATPVPLDYQLPADAYYHLIRKLRLTLPRPPGDSPDDLLRRDHAAIATIAGLAPSNAAEARLAAQFVAASEQWNDCLRLAQLPETGPEWAQKYRAQAATMMRQADSALRLLLHLQDARRKLLADNAACTRLDWTEHVAAALMAEALEKIRAESGERPVPSPAASAAPAECPATRIADPPALPPSEPAPMPQPPEEPEPDVAAEAEQYAVIYPERAALIRARGRVPDDVDFGPPDDDIVQALLRTRPPPSAPQRSNPVNPAPRDHPIEARAA